MSALIEMEQCPRRWALRHAQYDGVWDKAGYPPAPSLAALGGSAVHLALERIAHALAEAGCESAQTAEAVGVMRHLGGFSTIIENALLELLNGLTRNPRASGRMPVIKRAAIKRIPQLRERLQWMLARLRFRPRRAARSHARVEGRRVPLGPGSYPELPLRAPTIGWRGTADLLTIADDGAEIVDFKTGEPSDEHAFQLRVYALLWRLDSELNPNGLLARRLVVTYPQADTEVAAPDEMGLDDLRQNLLARAQTAKEKLSMKPPVALPSAQTCVMCHVRQLCPEYWQANATGTVHLLAPDDLPFEDLEIQLAQPEGPGTWSVKVLASVSLERGSVAKLQINSEQAPLAVAGRRLRLLAARVSRLEDFDLGTKSAFIVPSPWTEVFLPGQTA